MAQVMGPSTGQKKNFTAEKVSLCHDLSLVTCWLASPWFQCSLQMVQQLVALLPKFEQERHGSKLMMSSWSFLHFLLPLLIQHCTLRNAHNVPQSISALMSTWHLAPPGMSTCVDVYLVKSTCLFSQMPASFLPGHK